MRLPVLAPVSAALAAAVALAAAPAAEIQPTVIVDDGSGRVPRFPGASAAVPAPAGERAGAPDHPRSGPGLDLELAELYQLAQQGREGIYPAGRTGFSAVTTVCSVGEVPVPWIGPGITGAMGETHPFLGLAMYREGADGVLEMIGTSWIKHGYNVLASDECGLGCPNATSGQLNVGCSDTYTTYDNAERLYLGPREEVDPYTATWEACGSFFDGTPADCERDYFGLEPSPVTHRLAVTDADLDVPGSRFFYEAIYWVADDVYPWNGAGWQECAMTFVGGAWSATTLGGNAPRHGPLAASWGDRRSVGPVARNDGEVVLSARVTPLGGGQWHYQYALFNWRSRNGVGALEIPVGAASVSNVEFRDLNGPGADDWTATVAGGTVRWSTASQPLRYQTMFNFRFDADAPPADAFAVAEAFVPGIGPGFPFATRAPASASPPREVAGAAEGAGPDLSVAGPNPGGGDVTVAVTLPRAAGARITVVDSSGRLVRVLADGPLPAGRTDVRWDGRAGDGARAAAGVYFLRLDAGDASRTVKVTRLR